MEVFWFPSQFKNLAWRYVIKSAEVTAAGAPLASEKGNAIRFAVGALSRSGWPSGCRRPGSCDCRIPKSHCDGGRGCAGREL